LLLKRNLAVCFGLSSDMMSPIGRLAAINGSKSSVKLKSSSLPDRMSCDDA
jgi:hypothetical protein